MNTNKGIENLGLRTLAKLTFAVAAILMAGVFAARAATITVSSAADSGAGTLKQAVLDSNASAGVFDTIIFSVTTIALTTPLPAITDPVMIDGGAVPTVELNGLATQSANNNSIGLWIRAGGTTVRGLIINRFGETGIRLDTDSLGIDNGVTIIGNRIGTNAAGTAALGNINRGILIVGTTGHIIGNGSAAGANVISGNAGRGIEITTGGAANVRGNIIGAAANGTTDLGNASHGIFIVNSSNSSIGGTSSGDRNIISGNDGSGVIIIGDVGTPAANNSVTGNYIGVDATGSTALANSGSGVVVQDRNNTIGGATVGARNVISGNSVNGVTISTALATGNTVAGNYIGVGANGTTSIPNANDGVRITSLASNNSIGGAGGTAGVCNGACNVIANNGVATVNSARAAVYIDSTGGTGNTIRGNSFFANMGIGIDLGISPPTTTPPTSGTGSTPNDTGDADTGANNLQNFPVVASASTNGSIAGTLNSTANTAFAIDFFRNDSTDTAVGSEGRTFIGTTNLTTNGTGDASFSVVSSVALTAGQFVTATAITTGGSAQAIGDTSEFSAAQIVTAATAAQGIEADVQTRPNGDGVIDADDIQEIRRFVVGLDLPYQNNEFQRADDSPRSSSGDGFLDADDVQQSRRYSVGTDANQPTAGPTSPGSIAPTDSVSGNRTNNSSNGKPAVTKGKSAFRVESITARAGQTITVPIRVDTIGNEAGYSFTLNFDTAKLTDPVVNIGTSGGDVVSNITADGQIGFSITSFSGGTIAAGTNTLLVSVQFTVAPDAAGILPVIFNSSLARQKVSGVDPIKPLMQPTYTNGTITIIRSNAADKTVLNLEK